MDGTNECAVSLKVGRGKPQTVGEALDEIIHRARQNVEKACIKKAKAEALNILDHPADFYVDLLYPF